MTNKPAFEIRDGALKAVGWANSSEKGTFYSVDLIRSYKDGDNWKETRSLSGSDVLKGANLLNRAYNRMADLRAESKAADPEDA